MHVHELMAIIAYEVFVFKFSTTILGFKQNDEILRQIFGQNEDFHCVLHSGFLGTGFTLLQYTCT